MGVLRSFQPLGFHAGGFFPKTTHAVLRNFIRPIAEYGLVITPRDSQTLRELQQAVTSYKHKYDALKISFLVSPQEPLRNTGIQRALGLSQRKLLEKSCFSDCASLLLYHDCTILCRKKPYLQ